MQTYRGIQRPTFREPGIHVLKLGPKQQMWTRKSRIFIYIGRKRFYFKFGIKGEFQNNFPNPETGVKRIIPDYDKYDFGSYVISNIKLNKNWLLEGGIRFDYSKIDALKYYRKSFWESRNYNKIYQDIVVKELSNQVLTNPKRNFNNFSATIGLSKKRMFIKSIKIYLLKCLANGWLIC